MNLVQWSNKNEIFSMGIFSLITISVLCLSLISFSVSVRSLEINKLESFLDGVVYSQLDEHDITGATLSVVKDGEILVSRGYGYADLEEKKPIDPELSLFRPGSVSKLFTWTAVLQLVEQGEIDLYADINNYLNFEIPDMVYNNSNNSGPITVKHLMTHTPGFEDVGEGLFVLSAEEKLSLEEYLKKHLPKRVFPPGEVMAYSNYGSALAGYIVERISGQAFEDYVKDHIFEPLDMNNSTFQQPPPDDMASQMTRPYKYVGGEYYEGGFEYISGAPAGSMSTTASDMANFMIAQLQQGRYEGQQIMQEETIKQMHSQQFVQHPDVPGMTLGFIEEYFNGERVIGHGGGTTLFFTGLYLIPEQNLGLFVSYSNGTGLEAIKLFQAFMDYYFPEELFISQQAPDGALKRAEMYTGEYFPNRSNFNTFEKLLGIFQSVQVNVNEDGFLTAGIYGHDYQFVETGPGVYINRNNQGTQFAKTIAFTKDSDDNILLSTGGPITYSKTPWYGTISFLSLLSVLAILIVLGTLLGWIISYILHKFRKKKRSSSLFSKIARFLMILFSLFTVVFFSGLISIFTNINPAYGVPDIFFGIYNPVIFNLLLFLPYLMVVLTAVMMVFTVIGWGKKYWTVLGRLHYSVFTVLALGLMWVMFYTNFL